MHQQEEYLTGERVGDAENRHPAEKCRWAAPIRVGDPQRNGSCPRQKKRDPGGGISSNPFRRWFLLCRDILNSQLQRAFLPRETFLRDRSPLASFHVPRRGV